MALLRFRPEYEPLTLRADLLQFGPNPQHRLDAPHQWQHAFVEQLKVGVRADTLQLAAFLAGAPHDQAAEFIQTLSPVLHETGEQPTVQVSTQAIGAHDDELEWRVRTALQSSGAELVAAGTADTLALVVVTGAVTPAQCAAFMREDRAFLPIAFELGGVRVGPFVQPGATPCLMCRDLALTDEDPLWPTLQAKLIGRRPPLLTLDRAHLAVELALELLAEGAADATRWAIVTNSRQIIWRRLTRHADCGCQQP